MLDRDGGRDSFNAISEWFIHSLEELARVGTKCLHIAPLSLGINGVEGKAGLATPAWAGDDDEPAKRQFEVNSLKVVLLGSAEPYEIHPWKSAGFLGGLIAAQFFGAEKHALAHDFSGLELNGCAGGDDHVVLGFVRVATHAGFGEADFENAEVAELNVPTSRQGVSDAIQCELDNAEYFLLSESCFFADLHYQITFCEVGHMVSVLVEARRLVGYGNNAILLSQHFRVIGICMEMLSGGAAGPMFHRC